MQKLVALHKHWCAADSVKQFVSADVPVSTLQTGEAHLPDELLSLGQFYSQFLRLSIWYALLYVVIEGYRDLGQKDVSIEELLVQGDFVGTLRRFRNATFHYQEDPVTEKLLGFLEAEESETWIRQLNSAFQTFFERELPIKEMLEEMESNTPNNSV